MLYLGFASSLWVTMGAKDLVLKKISAQEANVVVKKYHYSGKVVPNSQIHIGVYYMGKLEGAMQYGPSIDKRRVSSLVEGTGWNQFVELNRMALSPALPKNSESRAIAISIRLLKTHAPNIKWIISFADATQCGDGAIYRAAGFDLTQIKLNKQMLLWDGKVIARKTLDNGNYPRIGGRYYSRHLIETGEAVLLDGYQLRYVYFIDPSWRSKLKVDVLPYTAIDEIGARMYRGTRPESIDSDAPNFRLGEGSANLTSGLEAGGA